MKDWIPALMLNKNYCPNNYYVAPVRCQKISRQEKIKRNTFRLFIIVNISSNQRLNFLKKSKTLFLGGFWTLFVHKNG